MTGDNGKAKAKLALNANQHISRLSRMSSNDNTTDADAVAFRF